jgi:hypothetical protein
VNDDAEIKVTSEMIDAGAAELLKWEHCYLSEQTRSVMIYVAMECVRGKPK